jgi:DNA-binding NarL/FixJ family response regulator
LVIADHPAILSALDNVIDGVGAVATVVAASNAADVRLALADETVFDLVLLDLQMGGAQGLGLLMELRADHPALPIVAVSAPHGDETQSIRLSSNSGQALRTESIDLRQSPLLSRGSGLPLSTGCSGPQGGTGKVNPGHARTVTHDLGPSQPGVKPHGSRGRLGLTPRQADVLELMMQGHSNKLIARELELSVETVKDHVAAIFRVLKVGSRTQAVVVASRVSATACFEQPMPSRAQIWRAPLINDPAK